MDPGKLIASGRTAGVHEVDAQRVIKRYVVDMPVTREVQAMQHVASYGYPVPEVFESDGFSITMARVDGPTMAASLAGGDLGITEAATILDVLHTRLHAIPPMRDAAERALIHLDLHPENVIMSSGGPVVIDWANAVDGDPDLDIAVTALILAQASLEPDWRELPLAELLESFAVITGGDPVPRLDGAMAMRLANPTMSPGELARLPVACDMVRKAFALR